jgi:Uma2 family endonuclease
MSSRAPVFDPPLVEGEHLDQVTFHARYEAEPPGPSAELIGGVVHSPGPIGRAHGVAHVPAIVWLSYYAENTPGVEVLDHPTTVLGWKSEPQPDAVLRVLPECGGRTWTERGFLRGAPELIVEIAKATRYVDLGPKLTDYEYAGVLEYLVRALDPDEVLWFEQEQGSLALLPTDGDGLHRSVAFPGLWLDPQALVDGDTRRLRAVLDLGLATPEHAEFVERLAAERRNPGAVTSGE